MARRRRPLAAARAAVGAPQGRRRLAIVAGLAVVLTAFNLRPAVTSFGALLPQLQRDIGMPGALAGVITSLPPICFGVFGLLIGRWARRRDTALVLSGAMVLTSVALLARVLVDRPSLVLLWTVPALAGMGVGNVLLPVAVKRWFPNHVGRATGLYSMALAVGTAAAAAASVPIAEASGSWRVGLGIWALPPLTAVPVWLWVRRRGAPSPLPSYRRPLDESAVGRAAPNEATAQESAAQASAAQESAAQASAADVPAAGSPAVGDPAAAAPPGRPVHRHRQAWALAGYFGLQSLGAYAVMGWLPSIYQDAGVDAATAGLLLALVTLLGAPISILLPELAARRGDQRGYVVGLAVLVGVAYLGLLTAPATLPALWATLLGIGMGAFPLALVLIGLRARSAEGTARLSALSQGVGYLVAAGGPLAIGLLHDATASWTPPLLVLIGLLVPQLLFGLVAAAPGHVD